MNPIKQIIYNKWDVMFLVYETKTDKNYNIKNYYYNSPMRNVDDNIHNIKGEIVNVLLYNITFKPK